MLLILGSLLIIVAIIDIFLTVLYAGSGSGLLSPWVGQGGWAFFRAVGRRLGRWRRTLLSFAGPILTIVIAAAWSLLLAVGFALLFWPALGVDLQSSQGSTPPGFVSALYYSLFSLTTLGIGDIAPHADHTRLLTVLEAALGFSFFTLTITYIVTVYSALQRRNTFASVLHHRTGGTGNALYFVADLETGADPGRGQELIDLACRAADLLESHKFYPVLHYFIFRKNRYALPRMAMILMDTVSLLENLPLPGRINLRPSVSQLDSAACNLIEHLEETFHPRNPPDRYKASTKTIQDWRRHYRKTLRVLEERGIELTGEISRAEEGYIQRRLEWHPHIALFTYSLGYTMEEVLPEVDPAAEEPEGAASA